MITEQAQRMETHQSENIPFQPQAAKRRNCPHHSRKAKPKRVIRCDKRRNKDRHLIENAFLRLKNFRRVATRYNKLTRSFLPVVALAMLVTFWL